MLEKESEIELMRNFLRNEENSRTQITAGVLFLLRDR
jgi:hypothetical protein